MSPSSVGLGFALALTRLLSALLFGITATDPITFALVAIGLTSIALLSNYLTARPASRVDPVTALRDESLPSRHSTI